MGILYIYGTGGLGREIIGLAREYNSEHGVWTDICFINDFTEEKECMEAQIFSFENITKINTDDEVIIAVGEPAARGALYKKVTESGFKLATVVYPGFVIPSSSDVGKGSIINRNSVITVNVKIGENCVINKGVIAGHDVQIGSCCVICPSVTIGGFARIGEGTFIGSGATIRDRVSIGKNCIIGMGAVVTGDIKDNEVVYGNPARHIRFNDGRKIFGK